MGELLGARQVLKGWRILVCTSVMRDAEIEQDQVDQTGNGVATRKISFLREENTHRIRNGTEKGREGRERERRRFYDKRMHGKGGRRIEDNSKA